jgi:hypothetical protein
MSGAAVNFAKVCPAVQMVGEDEEDTRLLGTMLAEARSYLSKHNWCGRIEEEYFGFGVGGIAAVFLFRIRPAKPSVDPLVWVVVGDIPPLYISTDDAPNPACALDAYLGAITHWAKAAIAGGSMKGMPPINADPTKENGQKLMGRIEFIDRELLKPRESDLVW